jgi:hypothetical protein
MVPENARRRQIRGVRWVDFFLFPHLKSIMKGARFADVMAIQERVTVVLRSIPKEAFADSFQKLYERRQQRDPLPHSQCAHNTYTL